MDWVAFVVQWLHVLLGMLWFINALLVATVLIPTLSTFPLPIQREVGGRYGERTVRIFNVVIPIVIVLGFLRGTVFGPIKSVEAAFTTAYGVTCHYADQALRRVGDRLRERRGSATG